MSTTTTKPTTQELIDALRRGDRLRYRVPRELPSRFAGKECDLFAIPTRLEVVSVHVGPAGCGYWPRSGRSFWANDAELRDVCLEDFDAQGIELRIIPAASLGKGVNAAS